MRRTFGYAAEGVTAPLAPFWFDRRDPQRSDVRIEIHYCGVCHSDLHTVRGEWGEAVYPCVPGHEIVGRVVQCGDDVKRFQPGDCVGVGCIVDACLACEACREGHEQYCNTGMVGTYNSADRHTGGVTYGGFSKQIVVDERFVLRMSEQLNPAAAAPLLCAGIATWSPLRHWNVRPGSTIGIVGIGGVGHMGIKLAHALGAHVVVFTSSAGKVGDAVALGADEVVISRDTDAMAARGGSLDFVLNTVAASHNLDPFLHTLRRDGVMALIGAPSHPHPTPSVMQLIARRRSIAGTFIGGIRETQEMLDFCAEHGIVSEIELIPIEQVNRAFERMVLGDVKYRFVLDLTLLAEHDG